MERLRELIVSGEGVKEIKGIDVHINSLSEINSRTKELLATLNELKGAGVESVIHIDSSQGVIKLKGSDMLGLAMQKDATFERVKNGFLTKVAIGNTSIEAVLKSIDVFNIEREKRAFIFSDAGLKARDLYEFIEHMGSVDTRRIEHYFYNGDFRRWLVVAEKKGLAASFKRLESKGLLGNELRSRLILATKNYVKGRVKKEVKEKIKRELKERLLSAMEEL